MISWSDTGIVITSVKKQEKYQAIEIFTENHGLVRALCDAAVRMCCFSLVSIDWNGRNLYEPGFWRIQDMRQSLAKDTLPSVIIQRVCYLLHRVLPYGDRAPELFAYVRHISGKISNCSSLEALNFYAYFEFLLLKTTGYGFDLSVCGICGCQEKIEYISRISGRGISRKCHQFSAEKVFKVPDVWKAWDKDGYCPTDLEITLNSIAITGHFIRKLNSIPNGHVITLDDNTISMSQNQVRRTNV
ncbi:MAG: DNA repair protein RecO [Holosporales bacterium]|jgi:DNA repair protein RecO|nr:DNA repair protein RecO [Holosporales bacterium]